MLDGDFFARDYCCYNWVASKKKEDKWKEAWVSEWGKREEGGEEKKKKKKREKRKEMKRQKENGRIVLV